MCVDFWKAEVFLPAGAPVLGALLTEYLSCVVVKVTNVATFRNSWRRDGLLMQQRYHFREIQVGFDELKRIVQSLRFKAQMPTKASK